MLLYETSLRNTSSTSFACLVIRQAIVRLPSSENCPFYVSVHLLGYLCPEARHPLCLETIELLGWAFGTRICPWHWHFLEMTVYNTNTARLCSNTLPLFISPDVAWWSSWPVALPNQTVSSHIMDMKAALSSVLAIGSKAPDSQDTSNKPEQPKPSYHAPRSIFDQRSARSRNRRS